MFGEMLVDFAVSGNGLRNLRGGIVIPVVFSAAPDQNAAELFDLPDEIPSLHEIMSSATLRTPGISPLVRSLYRSLKFSCNAPRDSAWVI